MAEKDIWAGVINEEAIDNLTDEQVTMVLDILKEAGY